MEDFKSYSIIEYLEGKGNKGKKKGSQYYFFSPWGERSRSLAVHPSRNVFFDFSTGEHGDIVDLVRNYEGCSFVDALSLLKSGTISKTEVEYSEEEEEAMPNVISVPSRLSRDWLECKKVKEYANSRSIFRDYVVAKYYKDSPRAGLGFIHRDIYLRPTGIRIRSVEDGGLRWFMYGDTGFYIIRSSFVKKNGYNNDTITIISESETSSNSLFEFLDAFDMNFIVFCIGGISTIPTQLPVEYEGLKNRHIVIDYDGSEEKYNQRIERFKHLNANAIKITTDKGEDINFLLNEKRYSRLYGIIESIRSRD